MQEGKKQLLCFQSQIHLSLAQREALTSTYKRCTVPPLQEALVPSLLPQNLTSQEMGHRGGCYGEGVAWVRLRKTWYRVFLREEIRECACKVQSGDSGSGWLAHFPLGGCKLQTVLVPCPNIIWAFQVPAFPNGGCPANEERFRREDLLL